MAPRARSSGTAPSQIVLIGAAAVGKSTVGIEVAARLHRPFVDLDEVACRYYCEAGQPIEQFLERVEAVGLAAAHRWWQPARAHAAARVVEDHPGAVIAFGAGHSHFEDELRAEPVRRALDRVTVVLLLPYLGDDAASVMFLTDRRRRGRIESSPGAGLVAEWVRSEQNRRLATSTIVVADRTPHEIATEIVERLSPGPERSPARGDR